MAFFDKLKKDLTAAGQLTAEKAKKAADILALKEQIRQINFWICFYAFK